MIQNTRRESRKLDGRAEAKKNSPIADRGHTRNIETHCSAAMFVAVAAAILLLLYCYRTVIFCISLFSFLTAVIRHGRGPIRHR